MAGIGWHELRHYERYVDETFAARYDEMSHIPGIASAMLGAWALMGLLLASLLNVSGLITASIILIGYFINAALLEIATNVHVVMSRYSAHKYVYAPIVRFVGFARLAMAILFGALHVAFWTPTLWPVAANVEGVLRETAVLMVFVVGVTVLLSPYVSERVREG